MSLFNPDDFPSPADPKEPKRKRSKREPLPAYGSDGYWHVIAQSTGPLPFCHRLDPFTPSKLKAEGSVVTRCEIVGRVLYTPWVGQMIYLCPDCLRIVGSPYVR